MISVGLSVPREVPQIPSLCISGGGGPTHPDKTNDSITPPPLPSIRRTVLLNKSIL